MIIIQKGKVIALLIFVNLWSVNGFSQLPASGKLRDYITAKISAMPKSGSNDYADPTASELAVWETAMQDLLDGKVAEAHTTFGEIGYRVVAFSNTSNDKTYHIVEKEATSTHYWGLYIIDPGACRTNLVIQSPHPGYDTNTGHQGVFTFEALETRAFFLSGAHRCSSNSLSECSGTTSACGNNGPFRVSDPAHNSEGMFQQMTEILLEDNPGTVFIQLHGFGKQASDPNAILSNGTRITPQKDYIGELVAEMKSEDATLSFRVAHVDLSWDRLLAFTNTQGRLINGSIEPCTSGASGSQGQFIHIEQELAKFRSDEAGWIRWIGPMSKVFECDKKEPLSSVETNFIGVIYPNPFTDYVSIRSFENPETLLVYNTAGQLLLQLAPTNWNKIDLSALETGTYLYQLLGANKTGIHSGRVIKH